MEKIKQGVITYHCNLCLTKRMAIIPQSLNLEVDERGLIELVDTHQCKETEIKSNILFVDSNYSVRSQVTVSYDEDSKTKKAETSPFDIPLPAKTEFPQQRIFVDNSFEITNIKELNVKDKLRQLIFTTELEQNNDEKLIAVSPLNFIEISINRFDGIDEKNAIWWLENIANILEEVVYADEKIFTFLFSFIDSKISRKFIEDELVEIDYLCNSHLSIPISTEKSIETFKQKENVILGNLPKIYAYYYLQILNECLNNEKKTLHDLIVSHKSRINISNFLYTFHTLTRNSLIKLDKLHFFTVSG
ncbi:MAG: hypothetical protein H7641_00620 [Candidatus Heimdallarchaeota archaeon]|nr:hypothetical protein [Candidatus Heimdallarchaeota archaeon]MCK4876069.1 hypothetical protein [Candidatus Heimdallarchaeota archaeon]